MKCGQPHETIVVCPYYLTGKQCWNVNPDRRKYVVKYLKCTMQDLTSFLLKFFTALIVISWASLATADSLNGEKSFCEKKALIKTQSSEKLQFDSEYDRAMLSVAKLPEFLQVKNSINAIDKRNSMQFDSGRDEQYEIDGKCYWEVTVYVSREDENRVMYWHTFLVKSTGEVDFVNSAEGDYISLHQWRSSGYIK